MNRLVLIVFMLCMQCICFAQKKTSTEYIEAGISLIELFKKQPVEVNDDCIYEVKFKNKSSLRILVSVETTTKDSIISKVVVPSKSNSSIFSLGKGTYRYKVMSKNDELLKETEFIVNKCGKLDLEINLK